MFPPELSQSSLAYDSQWTSLKPNTTGSDRVSQIAKLGVNPIPGVRATASIAQEQARPGLVAPEVVG